MHVKVKEIVVAVRLHLLVDCLLTMFNVPLLSVFVERQHKDSSSFDLPFSEIMITI